MGNAVTYCKSDDSAPDSVTDAEAEGKEPVKAAKAIEKEEDQSEAEEAEGDDSGDGEDEDAKPDIQVKSSPYDPRFPTTNQARHCYTRYNEFHRCAGQKSEDDDECKFYQRAYRSICPGEWVEKWNEQRENGNWAGKY